MLEKINYIEFTALFLNQKKIKNYKNIKKQNNIYILYYILYNLLRDSFKVFLNKNNDIVIKNEKIKWSFTLLYNDAPQIDRMYEQANYSFIEESENNYKLNIYNIWIIEFWILKDILYIKEYKNYDINFPYFNY